jgi:hypothetical protein
VQAETRRRRDKPSKDVEHDRASRHTDRASCHTGALDSTADTASAYPPHAALAQDKAKGVLTATAVTASTTGKDDTAAASSTTPPRLVIGQKAAPVHSKAITMFQWPETKDTAAP